MMKRSLIASGLLLTVLFVGCANQKQEVDPYRQIYPIQSVDTINITGDLNTRVIIGSSLNRVTTYGPISVSQSKDREMTIKPKRVTKKDTTVLVEIQRLQQLNLSDMTNANISFQYQQSTNMNFDHLDQVALSGPATIPNFDIDNVSNLNMNKKIHLENVKLGGTGSVTAQDIYGSRVVIDQSGSTMAKLRGYVGIATINQKDSSSLDLFWAKSQEININAQNQSSATLAGYATKLIVNLSDSAKLDGTFLRTKNTNVTTEGHSQASVYAVDHLFARTLGQSTIYYFGQPKYIYKDNASGEGVILPGRPK